MSTPRIASLKGKNSFELVFKQCRKLSSGSLSAHLRFRRASENKPLEADPTEQPIRVGIMLRKKMLPSAVLRNRVKRLIREALRQYSVEQPHLFRSLDAMIVSWNTRHVAGSSTLRLRDVAPLVLNILEQAAAVHSVKHQRSST